MSRPTTPPKKHDNTTTNTTVSRWWLLPHLPPISDLISIWSIIIDRNMKGEKLFIVIRLSNCWAHLAFAHFIHIINHEVLLCCFPFNLFIKRKWTFFFFFFAFEWSQNRFLLVLRLLLRDFCLLNDHQSACVFFCEKRKEEKRQKTSSCSSSGCDEGIGD